MKKLYLLLFFTAFSFVHAQLYHSNWIFTYGNHVKFHHSNQPNAVIQLPLPFNDQPNIEGSTTYSDFNGNLLLYTNSEYIYNRFHEPLNTEPLDGSATVTQSSIIVPFPGHYNEYFLFTVNGSLGLTPDIRPQFWNYLGVNHYHIDLNKNNGRGKLTIPANKKLLDHSSQKITATKHANGIDFWVLTIRENKFYAYLIDKNGVNPPIISVNPLNFDEGGHSPTLKGQLKISPKGNKIGIAHKNIVPPDSFNGYISSSDYEGIIDRYPELSPGITLLYDFDNSTGKVSNEKVVYINIHTHFGVEFSPSGRFLYFNYNEKTFSGIAVYDIENDALRSAYVAQDNYDDPYFRKGHLQLGIDGRIYHAQDGRKYLSCIETPDDYIQYPANYKTYCQPLNNNSTNGISNFGNYYFNQSIKLYNSFDEKTVCVDVPITFWVNKHKTIESAFWDFGDGHTSTDFYPVHAYQNPGIYQITSVINGIEYIHQITVYETINLPTFDLIECRVDPNLPLYFNLEKFKFHLGDRAEYISFHLTRQDAEQNRNALDNYIVPEHQGYIYARIIGKGGCISYTEIRLIAKESEIVGQQAEICKTFIGGEFYLNRDDIRNLYPEEEIKIYQNAVDLLRYENEILNSIPIDQNDQAITIFVRKINAETCDEYIELNIKLKYTHTFDLMDTELCPYDEGILYTIASHPMIDTIEWIGLTGDDRNQDLTQPVIYIKNSGTYTARVITTEGCIYEDTFTISRKPKLNVTIEKGQFGNYIINYGELNANAYEFSLDEGLTWKSGTEINGLPIGTVSIWVRSVDDNTCILYKIEMNHDAIPNFFSPNADGINDVWKINGFEKLDWIDVKIFNRQGRILFQNRILNSNVIWDGKINGQTVASESYWYELITSEQTTYTGYVTVKLR